MGARWFIPAVTFAIVMLAPGSTVFSTDEPPGPLLVEIVRTSKPTIISPLEVQAVIHNKSDSRYSFKDVRLVSSGVQEKQSADCVPKDFDIPQKSVRSVNCELPSEGLRSKPSMLFYREESKEFLVQFNYSSIAGATDSFTYPLRVTPRAALAGIVLGGFIGVLLQPLFRRLWRKYSTGRWSTDGYEPSIWVAWVFGFMTVGIFLTVARYSESQLQNLPLAIDVKDFYGGVLCGMLFEPIGRWLTSLGKDSGTFVNPATGQQPTKQGGAP